jgi:HME family heavy-metal exporter
LPIDTGKISPMAVREYADWVLRPRLMAIAGVAQVIPSAARCASSRCSPTHVRMAELGITHEQLEGALKGFSANTSGGFLELNSREYLIRNLGRTSRLEDLQNLALTARNGQPILLQQIAEVTFAPAIKRGDAGFEGKPAVILGIQKQPTADTVKLTRSIEAALGDLKQVAAGRHGGAAGHLPPGQLHRGVDQHAARQADRRVGLRGGDPVLLPRNAAHHADRAHRHSGVDLDHGAGVQVLRPVDQHHDAGRPDHRHRRPGGRRRGGRGERAAPPERWTGPGTHDHRMHPLELVAQATMEVRSAILYATVIIVLVFLPLFFLPGIEGR